MSYKITIEKIDTVKVRAERRIDVVPFKDKDGYTRNYIYEPYEKEVTEEKTIYTQTTEHEIDLKAIINAFNT